MVRKIEGLENVLAIELGLPPNCNATNLPFFMEAASGELPIIVCLSPEQIPSLLGMVTSLHPVAVHLTQPRGMLPGSDGEFVTGRLYGHATFPIMLHAAKELVDSEVRVIADGGIIAHWQVEALLEVGVTAVGLGSVLWQVDPGAVFSTEAYQSHF